MSENEANLIALTIKALARAEASVAISKFCDHPDNLKHNSRIAEQLAQELKVNLMKIGEK